MRKIIISAFLAVLGMPIDMYGEREGGGICKRAGLMCNIMAGLVRAQSIRWSLNYIHSMKLLTRVLRPTQLE